MKPANVKIGEKRTVTAAYITSGGKEVITLVDDASAVVMHRELQSTRDNNGTGADKTGGTKRGTDTDRLLECGGEDKQVSPEWSRAHGTDGYAIYG